MNYYSICFDLNIDKNFIYKSLFSFQLRVRVLVKLKGRLTTGIILEKARKPVFSCNNIIEKIDECSIIKKELFDLALWMSSYYCYPFGLALFSVLDRSIKVETSQKIIKRKDGDDLILQKLSSKFFTNVLDLKKEVKVSGFYTKIENLEVQGFVEIKRSFQKKIVEKKANFIQLLKIKKNPKLTRKQSELYSMLKESRSRTSLKVISKIFSYSVVKSLEKKGLIEIVIQKISENPTKISAKKPRLVKLTAEQNFAYKKIEESISNQEFKTFFLYGKTGSGKTEIYFKAIKKVLLLGKTVLFLVPEIALTPMMIERFRENFPQEEIAILHSNLTQRERFLQWKTVKNKRIVLGVRSGVFAPLENIGLIIVDEEHEDTYKQSVMPFYNARDVAVLRAQKNQACIILGSATPSLASWHNIQCGKYQLLEIKQRPFGISFPKVEIVDMKKERDFLSKSLKTKIEDRLKKEQQIILLQNRRGHSSYVQCKSCGLVLNCPNCQISLNFHSVNSELVCHYCGYSQKMVRVCPECGQYSFSFGAFGTQKVQKIIASLFPEATILRVDSDTTNHKDDHQKIYKKIKNNQVDIIIGTQMIAKGLDFENVTLVGVLSADVMLNIPDFRSPERSFSLLTQVVGRAGRGRIKGHVVIQSHNPHHYCIDHVKRADFENFAQIELQNRHELSYAPFSKMARVYFSSTSEYILKKYMDKNSALFWEISQRTTLLGPIQAPIYKLKSRFRYHIIFKAKSAKKLNYLLRFMKLNLFSSSRVRVTIDVDPNNLM